MEKSLECLCAPWDDPKGEGKLMMGEKKDLIAGVSSVRR